MFEALTKGLVLEAERNKQQRSVLPPKMIFTVSDEEKEIFLEYCATYHIKVDAFDFDKVLPGSIPAVPRKRQYDSGFGSGYTPPKQPRGSMPQPSRLRQILEQAREKFAGYF
ncbi:hypothetical protein [Endozoicomonas sp. Mp262]|uniref:hypothetical protein n=1 Tax=Endozoicomonas sp. Mp262 TaxID=2919499 RepID=UPI0021DB1848